VGPMNGMPPEYAGISEIQDAASQTEGRAPKTGPGRPEFLSF